MSIEILTSVDYPKKCWRGGAENGELLSSLNKIVEGGAH